MNPSPEDIGRRIRTLRKEKGFTLAKMAELCQCSSSLLSQIETGAVNPSFSTLKSISDVLGISMASLFETSITLKDTPLSPIHANERKTLTTGGGVSLQLLSNGTAFPCEFILTRLPAGASTGDVLYKHDGKECGFILEGELVVETGGESYHMRRGDTITFDSSIPHRITNPGKKEAVSIWVNTVPWMFAIK
ncbi:MAG TPA: cupin domain-containing protein [Deltaproteobacteria bacterium]|nr:cupin domain-containing protein [Deltaproteobacteria bacterium]